MDAPIVFISHFRVKDGQLDSLKQHSQQVTEQIKANKIGTAVFLQYLNGAGTEWSIIHMFPDSASLDRHVEGAAERSAAVFEFVVPTRREVYGMPSAQVLAMLRPPEASGISFQHMPEFSDGFARIQQH